MTARPEYRVDAIGAKRGKDNRKKKFQKHFAKTKKAISFATRFHRKNGKLGKANEGLFFKKCRFCLRGKKKRKRRAKKIQIIFQNHLQE